MCGVIGLFSSAGDVFAEAVDGLFQMQHRGQDACGVAIADGADIRLHKGIGYVREVFAQRPGDEFTGHVACGHVRYPTQGPNRVTNAQPHLVSHLSGPVLALSSNGDVTNYHEVRASLEARGAHFVGDNDAELIVTCIAWAHLRDGMSLLDAIRHMQGTVRGAFSATLITRDRLFAIRDPFAVRPLSFGRIDDTWIVASETDALDVCLAEHHGDVEPGEVIEFAADGMRRHAHPDVVSARFGRARPAHCVFEHVYFSRPDAIAFGQGVYGVRKRIGAWLAEHEDASVDVVVPVPDSSNAVALGYAHASGVPFEFGLIRNHYVGRTFIQPSQARRDEGVRRKFNPLRDELEGRSVAIVDDSIVRGTTLRKIVRMVRSAGAREVHVRIGSPVTRHPCFYGVDTPSEDELIGNRMSERDIAEHLTADSLRYVTVEGLRACVGGGDDYCMACFDGAYPIPLTEAKQAGTR